MVLLVALTVRSIHAAPLPRHGRGELVLRCAVRGATVRIDNRFAGLTPLAYPIAGRAGSHLVTVEKKGYASFSEKIMLSAGKGTVLLVTLVPAALHDTSSDLAALALEPLPVATVSQPTAAPNTPFAPPTSDAAIVHRALEYVPHVAAVDPIALPPQPAKAPVTSDQDEVAEDDASPWYANRWLWAAAGGAVIASSLLIWQVNRGDSTRAPDVTLGRDLAFHSSLPKTPF